MSTPIELDPLVNYQNALDKRSKKIKIMLEEAKAFARKNDITLDQSISLYLINAIDTLDFDIDVINVPNDRG